MTFEMKFFRVVFLALQLKPIQNTSLERDLPPLWHHLTFEFINNQCSPQSLSIEISPLSEEREILSFELEKIAQREEGMSYFSFSLIVVFSSL
jgi:hypothetical protein